MSHEHYCSPIQTVIPVASAVCDICGPNKKSLPPAELERRKREYRKPHTLGRYKRELWIPVPK